MRHTVFAAAAILSISIGTSALAQPPGSRATPIQPGESCPPGTTEIRPLRCQAPELPAPSIVD